MKLYYSPGACSLSPHIVLEETGLKYDLEKVDLRTHKTEQGEDFFAINPKGYVPALVLDDGELLTEGPAIVQYLADQKPDSGLAPAPGSFERYRLQEWLTFIGTEIHKSFSPLFRPTTPDEIKRAAIEKIGSRFGLIAKKLDGKQFLLGDRFTAADAYLLVMLRWSGNFGIDVAQWPALKSYFERILSRPAVRTALASEGLRA
jgi:glutathione S-transferase